MQEILDSIKRVSDIMEEIAAASREQASGIGQVNDAITQMDQVTQQNAALVEQAAAAAESLQEQAMQLSQAVGVFKGAADHTVPKLEKRQMVPGPASASPAARSGAGQASMRSLGHSRVAATSESGSDWEQF